MGQIAVHSRVRSRDTSGSCRLVEAALGVVVVIRAREPWLERAT
jgi:hypothetical protein